LLQGGEVHPLAAKRLLRTDDVFIEGRWFMPAQTKITGQSPLINYRQAGGIFW